MFVIRVPCKYVATPIQIYGNHIQGKRAMYLLKHKILKNIVLRRTKKGRAADLALPPRIVSFVSIWLCAVLKSRFLMFLSYSATYRFH